MPLPTAAAVVDTSMNVLSSLTSWTTWALGGQTADDASGQNAAKRDGQ